MTLRCIDIETTGIDPSLGRVGQVGVDETARGDLKQWHPALEAVIDQFKGADGNLAHDCFFEQSFLEPFLGTPPRNVRYALV
jgi:hypothetical protein